MRRTTRFPSKKLRNPGRRLRSLEQWPERIADQIPSSEAIAGQRYWNFKIPTLDRLVEPPYATDEIRRTVLRALFAATEAVEKSIERPADCRIGCLVEYPWLFGSEVTIFFDDDCFDRFRPPADRMSTDTEVGWFEASAADPAVLDRVLPRLPDGLECFGGTAVLASEPPHLIETAHWLWAYPRR